MMFMLGFFLGQSVTWLTIWWLFIRPDDTTTVDLWWAENPERWAGLRQILLDESGTSVGEEPDCNSGALSATRVRFPPPTP